MEKGRVASIRMSTQLCDGSGKGCDVRQFASVDVECMSDNGKHTLVRHSWPVPRAPGVGVQFGEDAPVVQRLLPSKELNRDLVLDQFLRH